MEQPKLINNITERVADDLKERLSRDSRVSVAAASFSIYAFEALKKELEDVEELRFIFTSPTFIKEKAKKEKREYFIPKLNRERSLYGTDFEIRLRNQLSQKAIAKEQARREPRFASQEICALGSSTLAMRAQLYEKQQEDLPSHSPASSVRQQPDSEADEPPV